MALGPGSLLKENIELRAEIGSGAMGVVFLGYNHALGSEVAVKVLREQGSDREQIRARFTQEARAVAQIDNPHVVRIFDYGVTAEGEPFFVMEMLRGTDLRAHLQTHGPLTLDQAITVLRQVCSALGRAHQLGIVHRDIKPANIFLQHTGGDLFAKVLDFGVAKHAAATDLQMTSTGVLLGTPYYMSPEQFVSPRSVDHRTDLWACAVVIYACLLGELPFVGETIGALSIAVHKGHFKPPSRVSGALPAGIDAWFDRALATDPDARFQSAGELAEALARAAQDVPVQMRTMMLAASPLTETPVRAHGAAPAAAPTMAASHASAPGWPTAPFPAVPSHHDGASPHGLSPHGVSQLGAVAAHGGVQAGVSEQGYAPAGSHLTPAPPPRSWAVWILACLVLVGVGAGVGGMLLPWLQRESTGPSNGGPAATATPVEAPAPATAGATSAPEPPPPEGMVAVPAGAYWVGCDADRNEGCFDDEKPGRIVEISRFFLMRHEVTQGDYEACVAAKVCPALAARGCRRATGGDRPVTCVSWQGATAYCEHRDWRLPTEQEWEAAARGADRRAFPWGDEAPTCERAAIGGCGAREPLAVGSRPGDTSPAGALDLGGNVREWTSSEYRPYPGGTVEPDARGKVNRGSSFDIPAARANRAHTRLVDPPDTTRADIGFRCALDPPR